MTNDPSSDILIAEKYQFKNMNEIPELENFGAWSKFLLTSALLFPILATAVDPNNVVNVQDIKNEIELNITKGNNDQRYFHIFMHGIIMAESGYNPKAISKPDKKGRRAWGLFQFRQRTIDDINRVYKTNYTTKDALDPSKAVDMYNKYFIMLVKYYKHFFKKNPTYADIAMMYKEGLRSPDPNNKYHDQALKYWKRVEKFMNMVK